MASWCVHFTLYYSYQYPLLQTWFNFNTSTDIGINNELEVIGVHPNDSQAATPARDAHRRWPGWQPEVMGWTTMTETELLISILLWPYCADHGITHTWNTVPFMASPAPQNKILYGTILPGQPALWMSWSDVIIEWLRYCWVLGNRRANHCSGYRGKASH